MKKYFLPDQLVDKAAKSSILGMLFAILMIMAGYFPACKAQIPSDYIFSVNQGTYTPITGGAQLNSQVGAWWVSPVIALSPGFTFAGSTYTTAYITSNGFIALGGVNPPTALVTNPFLSTTGSGIIVSPFATYLNNSQMAGASPEIRLETVGNEHVFQWKDAARNSESTADRFSFQARLNTATGEIRFVYHTDAVANSTLGYPKIGIRTGTTPALYKNLNITTAGPETWLNPLQGTAGGNAVCFNSNPPNPKFPPSGLEYKYAPPAPCSTVNAGTAVVTPISICGGAYQATLSLSGATMGLGGVGYFWEYMPLSTGVWTAVPDGDTSVVNFTAGTACEVRCTVTCPAASQSAVTSSVSITPPPPVTTPYLQTFDNAPFPPTCWRILRGTLGPQVSLAPPTTLSWSQDNWLTGASIPDKAARVNIQLISKRDWLISPPIDIGMAGDKLLEFDLAIRNVNTWANVGLVNDDSVALLISTDGGLTWSNSGLMQLWTVANTPLPQNPHMIIPLTAYTGTIAIAFYISEGNQYDYSNACLQVNNFLIHDAPQCLPPSALTATNITDVSADIAWQPNGMATQWQVEYGPAGFAAGAGTTANVSSPSLSLSGLNYATDYEFYVRSDCGPFGYSAWSAVGSFTTDCNTPLAMNLVPASRCSTGTVELAATASSGQTLLWYDLPTAGTLLDTGSLFTTPVISATTDFYVAAFDGMYGETGRPEPAAGTATFYLGDAGVFFNASVPFKLHSVDVYITSPASTANFRLVLPNGTTLQQTGSIQLPGGSLAAPVRFTVPLNFNVPAGTGFKLLKQLGGGMLQEPGIFTAGATVPLQAGPLTVGAITNGYSVSNLTDDKYYFFYNWKISKGCEGPRFPVTASVIPAPPVFAGASDTAICVGDTTQLIATSVNPGYSYQWLPGNLAGDVQSVTPTIPTLYIVTATDNNPASPGLGCIAKDTVLVVVSPLPLPPVVTPSPAYYCPPSPVTLTVTNAAPSSFQSGNLTNQNTANGNAGGYPAPYTALWGGQRMQMLIRASELQAAGFSTGAAFNAIRFPVSTLGAGWGTDIIACNDFQVSIEHTTVNNLTAFQSGLTQVCAPSSFTPAVGYANVHTFNSPLLWDGVSNIIIETTFSNNSFGSYTDAVIQYNAPIPTDSITTIVYRADYETAADMASATGVVYTYMARPDFHLEALGTSVTWSPSYGLSSTTGETVWASPAVDTSYTVTIGTLAGCSASDTVSVYVSVFPSVDGINMSSMGQTYDLTADNPQNYTSLTWDFGDSSPFETGVSVTHSFAAGNSYQVRLIAANECGVDTAVINIDLTTGIGHLVMDNDGFSVYPNPAKDIVNIEGPAGNKIEQVEVTNISGARLQHYGTVNASRFQWSLGDLPGGIYLIRIMTEKGIYIKKLSVTK